MFDTTFTKMKQNSSDWQEIRLGRIGGSTCQVFMTQIMKNIDVVKTEKWNEVVLKGGIDGVEWKNTKAIENRIAIAVAESLSVRSEETFTGNVWTDRGLELEPEAIAELCKRNGVELWDIAGFQYASMGAHIGASVDVMLPATEEDRRGVVGEIKCCKLSETLIRDRQGADPSHVKQLLWNMAVCNVDKGLIFYYFPDSELDQGRNVSNCHTFSTNQDTLNYLRSCLQKIEQTITKEAFSYL